MVFTHWEGSVGSYVGAAGSVAWVEAVDITGDVAKGEIAKLDAGVVWAFGAAGVSLVDVCLVVCQSLLVGTCWAWRRLTWVMKTGNVTL